jgi:putative DNA primase/helicase
MIDLAQFETGGHRVECPACGRGPRDRTLGVTVGRDGNAVAHCFRCSLVQSRAGGARSAPSLRAARNDPHRKHQVLSEYGRAMWQQCVSSHAPLSRSYLEARGCVLPPEDGDLRFYPALRHPSGYAGPALVALVTDAATGEPLTLHRTWVRADGSKAPVNAPRMLLGGHRKKGGVIRLFPGAPHSALGIAEGVETALTLAHAVRPVWATVDAGNMGTLPVIPCVGALVIGVDHDPAGMKAARMCAARWSAGGREVRLVVPPAPGSDLNDFIRSRV